MLWARGVHKALSANPTPLKDATEPRENSKLGSDWTKTKRSHLDSTTQLLSCDPWYSTKHCTFQQIKPVLFPSSVLHEWLISTNDNGANCSKSILQHVITVGNCVKNYPLFQTNHFTLFNWKKSKIPGVACSRKVSPAEPWQLAYYMLWYRAHSWPECAGFKRRRHAPQSLLGGWGGVKHPLYWALYDNSWGATAEEGNREGTDDVDLKSNLKIFTIFNSHPLCQLSCIFYCKVNCLPNGHCEDSGSRNNLPRNWCSMFFSWHQGPLHL